MSARIHWPASVHRAPPGWRWGAHTSGPGWEGYYLLGEDCREGATLLAVQRPDMNAEDAPTADELWASWLVSGDRREA